MAGLFDELRVLLHGIWNRRWIALAVAWGVAMLGWLGVALIPNSYQSKARVYVNTQSLLEDRMGITQVQSQQDLDRLRSTLASVLRRRSRSCCDWTWVMPMRSSSSDWVFT